MNCKNLDLGNYVIAPKTGEGISMVYREDWIPGVGYDDGEVVRSQGYTSVVRDGHGVTYEDPTPVKVGDATYLYNGDIPDTSVLSKQILIGTRYTPQVNIFALGFRIDVVAGNEYVLYGVEDPFGAKIVTQFAAFVASTTGWVNIQTSETIILAGTVFDIMAKIREPASTPTTWSENWDYDTPNNNAIPSNGEIVHANRSSELIRISNINSTGGDMWTPLSELTIGDVIGIYDSTYAIQETTDNATYFEFQVSPAIQAGPDGVTEVTFETVTATPISFGFDNGYYSGVTGVSGFYSADGVYENGIVDDNAYGIDILVQEGEMSDDWHILAHSTGVATVGSSSAGEYPFIYNKVQDILVPDAYDGTPDNTLTTPPLPAGTYSIGYSFEVDFGSHRDKPLIFKLHGTYAGIDFAEAQPVGIDLNNKSRYYAFPKEVSEGAVITHGIEFYDYQGGNSLVVNWCDVFINRLA